MSDLIPCFFFLNINISNDAPCEIRIDFFMHVCTSQNIANNKKTLCLRGYGLILIISQLDAAAFCRLWGRKTDFFFSATDGQGDDETGRNDDARDFIRF